MIQILNIDIDSAGNRQYIHIEHKNHHNKIDSDPLPNTGNLTPCGHRTSMKNEPPNLIPGYRSEKTSTRHQLQPDGVAFLAGDGEAEGFKILPHQCIGQSLKVALIFHQKNSRVGLHLFSLNAVHTRHRAQGAPEFDKIGDLAADPFHPDFDL